MQSQPRAGCRRGAEGHLDLELQMRPPAAVGRKRERGVVGLLEGVVRDAAAVGLERDPRPVVADGFAGHRVTRSSAGRRGRC